MKIHGRASLVSMKARNTVVVAQTLDDQTLEQFRAHRTDRTRARLLEAAQGWSFPVAFGVLRQREDAEDVAQEVLLELLEALPTLRDTEHLRRWTYRASLHEAIDHRRRKLRRMKRETDRELAPRADEPDFDLDDVLALHAGLAQLDDDAQEVLIGYFFEGCTLAQLAGRRDCSTTHVWNQIERGKSALARRLERAGYAAAAPLTGSWLEAMPSAPPTPPVSPEVLVRAQALTSASPAAASAIGVFVMTTATKTSVTLVAVGVLAFALGLGAQSWLGNKSPEKVDRRSSANVPIENGAPPVAVDTAEWESTIASLREENAQLAASLARATAAKDEAASSGTEPGADPLVARLNSLLSWMQLRRVESQEVEDRGDPKEIEEYFNEMLADLRKQTKGLRDLMIEHPESLLSFLDRADVDDDFIALIFDTMIPKDHRADGTYRIETDTAPPLPAAILDGVFALCEESNARLKGQGLSILLETSQLEDRHLEQVRGWIDSPDADLAAVALRVYERHAKGRSAAYDDALRNEIYQTLRETNPEQAGLISSSISALQDIETPEATALLLELLETGRYARHDLTVTYALMNRATSLDANELATYARALIAAARRVPSGRPGTADSLVQSALRFPAATALPVLEALVPRVDARRVELLTEVIHDLRSGESSSSALWSRYEDAVR